MGDTVERVRDISANDSQKRSIASALALLDEALCLFEEYGRGREIRSVFYQERNKLTAEQRQALLAAVARMRRHLRQIKNDLGLPARTEDVDRRIWGHSAGFWEMLAELNSRRLRAYGEVAPQLAEYLDPKTDQLIEELQRVSGITGRVQGKT
jgi:hypothetical protein